RMPLTWDSTLERVTRIELALSAWEAVPSGLLCGLTCGAGCPRVTVRDHSSPRLMARQWPGYLRPASLALRPNPGGSSQLPLLLVPPAAFLHAYRPWKVPRH